MKTCLKCLTEKEINKFGKDKHRIDGLNPYCKDCIKKISKVQRINNPIYVKQYAEKYREKNREILRKQSNERFAQNKELYLEKNRKAYHRNKIEICLKRKKIRETDEAREKERIRQSEWRKSNPELYRKWIKDWQTKNRIKINAHAKVHRAVKTGKLIRAEYCEECKKNVNVKGIIKIMQNLYALFGFVAHVTQGKYVNCRRIISTFSMI